MKKIAIDAMGGENAPQAIIGAVLKIKPKLKGTKFILFGGVEKINQLIPDEQKERIEITATGEVTVDSDEPVRAIRRKKDSSMVVAANYVKAGKADALLLLENTGALLAHGIFTIGRIKGVERPALIPASSNAKNEQGFNIIDVSASAQNKPEYLARQAQMANFYVQKIRNIQNPTVTLPNNGVEDNKEDPLHQEAYRLLKEIKPNFTGSIEGNNLMEDKADVIVTDGFAGDITLKAIEEAASVILHLLKDSLLNNGLCLKAGALLARPGLTVLKERFDTARCGGAVLLDVNAFVVRIHERSNTRPIYYTLL